MKSLKNKTLLRTEIEKAYTSKEYRYGVVLINPDTNMWRFMLSDDKVTSDNDIIFTIDLSKKISYWRKNKYCKIVFALAGNASEVVTAWLQKLEYDVYGVYVNNDPSLMVELADEVNSPLVLLNKGYLRNILNYTTSMCIYIHPKTGEWSENAIPNSIPYNINLSSNTHYYKANDKRVYEYTALDDKKATITAAIQKIEIDVLGLQYINGREIRKITMKGN